MKENSINYFQSRKLNMACFIRKQTSFRLGKKNIFKKGQNI